MLYQCKFCNKWYLQCQSLFRKAVCERTLLYLLWLPWVVWHKLKSFYSKLTVYRLHRVWTLAMNRLQYLLERALFYAAHHFQVRTLNPISRNRNTSKKFNKMNWNNIKYFQLQVLSLILQIAIKKTNFCSSLGWCETDRYDPSCAASLRLPLFF